jgi:hypothetical protein
MVYTSATVSLAALEFAGPPQAGHALPLPPHVLMSQSLSFFCQSFPCQMVIQWQMRVSRKAAKAQRKRDELREPTLCVSAPLREILLYLPEVIFSAGTETFPASAPSRDFVRSELLACRVRPVFGRVASSSRLDGPAPHQHENQPAVAPGFPLG